MAKATHYGECQICGCRQKLPGSVLSLHGYSVEYGFFSGTCNGAGYLPFEKDFSLISRQIKIANETITSLKKQIAELRASPHSPRGIGKVWKNEYFSATGHMKAYHAWVEVEVRLTEKTYDTFIAWNVEYLRPAKGGTVAKWVKWDVYDTIGKSEKEMLLSLIKPYIDHLKKNISGLTDYIVWQEKRIADWGEKPLTPVEDDAAVAAAKPYVLAYRDGSGFVGSIYNRNAYKVEIAEKAARYNERGAKMMLGKVRGGYKVLEVKKIEG